MSFFPAPYVGRFHHGAPRHCGPPTASFNPFTDIAPLFRIVDSALENLASPATAQGARRHGEVRSTPTFQPRFDVKESEESYELRGELPGVEAKDLEVKFADEQTLVIQGRTETEKTSGTPPSYAPAVEGKDNEKAVANEAANEADNATTSRRSSSASYVKPSVEDDIEGENANASTSATPSAAPEHPNQEAAEQQNSSEQQPEARNQSHYWYSERSTGTFQRTFHFPSHVDQDGVVANLKNGILDVAVPKRKAPEARKITVGGGT